MVVLMVMMVVLMVVMVVLMVMMVDLMYAAQDNAKYGLQQLEKAKGKTTKFYRETEDDEDDDSEDEYTQTTNLQPPQIRSESNGECQFPDIETLKEYYVEGKSGIYEFMEY